MIRRTISLASLAYPCNTLTTRSSSSISDWSHIYEGIHHFEDNSLGEDVLDIRNQAL